MLLQQLVVLHHVELQVAHRELARDADFLRGGGGGKQRYQHSGKQDGDQSRHDVSSIHAFFIVEEG